MIIDGHDYHRKYRRIVPLEYKLNEHKIVLLKISEGNYTDYPYITDEVQMLSEMGYIVIGYCFSRPIDNNGIHISGKEHADHYLEASKDVRNILAGDVYDGPELIKVNREINGVVQKVWYNDPDKINNDMAFDVTYNFFKTVWANNPENMRLHYINEGSWHAFYRNKWEKIEDKENHWFNDRTLITGSWEARYKATAPIGFGPYPNPILWQFDEASIKDPPFPIVGVYQSQGNDRIDSDKNQLMIPFDDFLRKIPKEKRGRYILPEPPVVIDPQIDPPEHKKLAFFKRLRIWWRMKRQSRRR